MIRSCLRGAVAGAFILLYAVPGCFSETQDSAKPAISVKATVYDVWIYDSACDIVHGGGHWIREVHIPDAGLSFNTGGYTIGLLVFRPDPNRYATEEPARKDQASSERKPSRKIREIELTKDEVEVFKDILRLKEKAATIAGRALADK